jgi:hypothetical protein
MIDPEFLSTIGQIKAMHIGEQIPSTHTFVRIEDVRSLKISRDVLKSDSEEFIRGMAVGIGLALNALKLE